MGARMERKWETLGFGPADILLPRGVDLEKWSVVACDQFTSQPDYWRAVEETVDGAPSTLHLILPEAHLHDPDVDRRIAAIDQAMEDYVNRGLFRTLPGSLVYVERTQSDGSVRRGLVGKVDLECYDYTPGAGSLIRATEGTVLSRIPPRVRVRRDAALELPHVMLLLDDPDRTVIEPLAGERGGMEPLYDFDLQQGGGHLAGWRLTADQTDRAAAALSGLLTPEAMERKYGMKGAAPLLFAVGDGNHSLAAAKRCWEEIRQTLPEGERARHPARYALVELVNNHDPALRFAPIHRVVFRADPEGLLEAFRRYYPDTREGEGEGHTLRYVCGGRQGVLTVPHPTAQLAVGTLQTFLDDYLKKNSGEVDYIHGDAAAEALGAEPGSVAFLLPAMGKEQLFRTVMAEGVLPRKTFSMGQARDKRYYLEARRIR